MGFLGFGKNKVVDWSARYKEQEQIKRMRERRPAVQTQTPSSSTENSFGFLAGLANSGSLSSPTPVSSSESYSNISEDAEEKRRRLTKRIMDMTDKIEELSNQIYHLQQRIDVLEKKTGVGSGY